MTLSILIVGAYTVMTSTEFTIGMLVAFQMFTARVSQPMLRLVGLWQQFQQANLSVQRLGDIMNAPTEPYSVLPNRVREGKGQIDINELAFRYAENLPFLYQGFKMSVAPGSVVANFHNSASWMKMEIDHYVQQRGDVSLAIRKQRALAIVGKYASQDNDVSQEHDRYLTAIYGEVGD